MKKRYEVKKVAIRLYKNDVDADVFFYPQFDSDHYNDGKFSYQWYTTKEHDPGVFALAWGGPQPLFIATTKFIEQEGLEGKFLYCERIDKQTGEVRRTESNQLFSDVKKMFSANSDFEKIHYYDAVGNVGDSEIVTDANEAYLIVLNIFRHRVPIDKTKAKKRLLTLFKHKRTRLSKDHILERGLNIYAKQQMTIDELFTQMKDSGLLQETIENHITITNDGYEYLMLGLGKYDNQIIN
ncbi:hypothetical protein [Bacillus pumilus]|uniref:hypothetical protein n=1 Tax=Bacillus pumilus TaxID=1408 RepID=UPI0011A2F16E|nr:hypothetical protein [Bacillus pumilus]